MNTATYWDAGRQIVEFEQGGKARATYGAGLLPLLSADLTANHGRGFSVDNLERFRLCYLRFPLRGISAMPLRKSEPAVLAWIETLAARLPLSWSHFTRFIRLKSNEAFTFYPAETLRGGWTIQQLERQIGSKFYERGMLSKNKAAMLTKGGKARSGDVLPPDEKTRHQLAATVAKKP